MNTRQNFLLGILIIAGGYLIFDMYSNGGDTNQSAENPTVAEASAPTAGNPGGAKGNSLAAGDLSNKNWFADFQQDSWGRDPFFYPAREEQVTLDSPQDGLLNAGASKFQLTGISRRGKDAFVIINNEVLSIGDVLNGAQLLEIHANSVIMKNDGDKFVVTLTKIG